MTTLPSVTGKDLLAALRKAKFDVVRVKGSHHFLRHPDGRVTVIPIREALRQGDIAAASSLGRVFRLEPVAASH